MKLRLLFVGLIALSTSHAISAQTHDPEKILEQAERLAWLKAWVQAAPLYAEAERLFDARNDRRNALFARISHVRGELHRLSVPEVSQQLAEYLELPLLQTDKALRLRCLVIKGETDEDLDPVKAERAWREAADIAKEIGDLKWANRAQGELGIVAYMQGDISGAIIQLGQALKVAETNGDTPSQIRWLTLFGHGHVQLGRFDQALSLYDRALALAVTIPELQTPVLTFFGKGEALAKLGRLDDAERVLDQALSVAAKHGALGHQAEINLKLALVAYQRKQERRALELLVTARELARRAGGNRILAEIALELARIQRAQNRQREAERTLLEGIDVARRMRERMLLPQLLARLADLRVQNRQYSAAKDLLDEANDLLEGLLANVSSPWIRSQLIAVMSDAYEARIRLEGTHGRSPVRMWTFIERARGRSLLELLLARPVSDFRKPAELRTGERAIAALQLRLYTTKGKAARQRLLDQIFETEERLAPASTALFDRTRRSPRKPVLLGDVQKVLRSDEVLVVYALLDPESYCLVVTKDTARLQPLAGRATIRATVDPLMKKVRDGADLREEATAASAVLLAGVSELASHPRLIVSADVALHGLPIELLTDPRQARSMLETHTVSYVPSGSVLAVLRTRAVQTAPDRAALAVGASPTGAAGGGRTGPVTRNVYDLELADLAPLPAANDEARSVASILGAANTTLLVGESATEAQLKREPLGDYRVLHFAGHAIPSIKFPARSALLFARSEGDVDKEDGLWQAREILTQSLRAKLVTLSACETGSGPAYGQEGISNLVRPFLAAGAQSVVANLWDAEDTFSLNMMRLFYSELNAGADAASALRQAKLNMLQQFGPNALPRLWSGIVVYGDGTSTVVPAQRSTR